MEREARRLGETAIKRDGVLKRDYYDKIKKDLDLPLACQVHCEVHVWAEGCKEWYFCEHYDQEDEKWQCGRTLPFLEDVHVLVSIDCETFTDRRGNMAWDAFHAFLSKIEKELEYMNYYRTDGYWSPCPVCEP